MPTRLFVILALALLILGISPQAFTKDSIQSNLDDACEAARQIALKPRKKEIYQECRVKFKKDDKACKREAKAFNGNRIGGSPMFYELPPCEKAFNYRKKSQ